MTTTTHPTPVVLYAFHSGKLTAVDQATVEAHVADCPDCGGVLARLPDAPLVLLAREAVRQASVADPTPLPGALRKTDP